MAQSDDIANLFDQFGGKANTYQELSRVNSARQSRERWPLLSVLDLGSAQVNQAPAVKNDESGTPPPVVTFKPAPRLAPNEVMPGMAPARSDLGLASLPLQKAAVPTPVAVPAVPAAAPEPVMTAAAAVAAPSPAPAPTPLPAAVLTPPPALASTPAPAIQAPVAPAPQTSPFIQPAYQAQPAVAPATVPSPWAAPSVQAPPSATWAPAGSQAPAPLAPAWPAAPATPATPSPMSFVRSPVAAPPSTAGPSWVPETQPPAVAPRSPLAQLFANVPGAKAPAPQSIPAGATELQILFARLAGHEMPRQNTSPLNSLWKNLRGGA